MKPSMILCFLVIIVISILIAGCMNECPQPRTVSVTPESVEKDIGLGGFNYRVTFDITNRGNAIEKSLMIKFVMNSGSDWDHSNNETETIEQLNSSESKKIVIDFSSIQDNLDCDIPN